APRAGSPAPSGGAANISVGRPMVPGGGVSDVAEGEVVVVSGHADDASALASASRGETLDLRATTESTADRPSGSKADRSAGTKKPTLGLSAYRRRAERSRRGRLGDHGEAKLA